MSFRNEMEAFVFDLASTTFHSHLVAYESISIHSPGLGSTTPDFDIYLSNRTLLVESTNAKLLPWHDPKDRQRKILCDVTPGVEQYYWMIVYLQNCMSSEGANLTIECLHALAGGEMSGYVQKELDRYARKIRKCPPLNKINWGDIERSTIGYVHHNHKRF